MCGAQILGCCAALDVCAARAGHAEWCGGARPRFVSPDEALARGSVQVVAPEALPSPALLPLLVLSPPTPTTKKCKRKCNALRYYSELPAPLAMCIGLVAGFSPSVLVGCIFGDWKLLKAEPLLARVREI